MYWRTPGTQVVMQTESPQATRTFSVTERKVGNFSGFLADSVDFREPWQQRGDFQRVGRSRFPARVCDEHFRYIFICDEVFRWWRGRRVNPSLYAAPVVEQMLVTARQRSAQRIQYLQNSCKLIDMLGIRSAC